MTIPATKYEPAPAPEPRAAPCVPRPRAIRASRLRLAGLARPAAVARHHTRATLAAWGLPLSVVDTAELVVGELATNAEQHAHGPLSLRLAVCPSGVLLIGVRDPDPTPPPPPTPAPPEAESGRGLSIITTLTTTHGTTYSPTHQDTWATLPLP
jgi:anti-sigma regulatory factor (Ser/Thr protein kinase)